MDTHRFRLQRNDEFTRQQTECLRQRWTSIRRRFESGLRNLFDLYQPLLDGWWLYDASRLPPPIIASEEGQLTALQPELYNSIQQDVKE